MAYSSAGCQKAKEEARRRKSKSQFFEMIQEIRKVVRLQKEQRRNHPEAPVTIQPRQFPHEVGSPVLVGSPVIPLDTQRLLFVPQSSSSPPKTRSSWTDLCKRGPTFFGTTKYSHLTQLEEPVGFNLAGTSNRDSPPSFRPHCLGGRNDSPLEDLSSSGGEDQPAFDTTVLSISVEDLRLVDTSATRLLPLKRHGSLDDALSKRKNSHHSPKKKKLPSVSEPKMVVRRMLEVDELLLYSMSKEEIIHSWQASERKLLNRLRDTIKEKKSLERKLVFIQKTLVKPP